MIILIVKYAKPNNVQVPYSRKEHTGRSAYFGSSRLPYFLTGVGEKKYSKMALRTICAVALRSGTDLGVSNARKFVTTGIVTKYSF